MTLTLASFQILVLALVLMLLMLFAMYHYGFMPGTIPAWTKQLKDPDRMVRLRAIAALSRIRSAQSAYCLSLVAKSADEGVKHAALRALIKIQDPAGIPTLQQALTDRDPRTRRVIAEGLVDFPDTVATRMLTDLLGDLDETVIGAAAAALGARRDPSATRYLARCLGDSEDMARVASQALIDIGPSTFPILRELIPDLPNLALERLIPLLVTLDRQAAIEPLRQIMDSVSSAYLVEAAIHALMEVRSPDVYRALLAHVRKEGRPARHFALSQLAGWEDPELDDVLNAMIHERDVKMRRAAVAVLASRPTAERFDLLLDCVSDNDHQVVAAACEGLGSYDDPRVISHLLETLWPHEVEEIAEGIGRACRKPLAEIRTVEDFYPVLKRTASREARSSEDSLVRHHLQSLIILLKPDTVCGFADLTNTVLVFLNHDFVSEYQESRLHPIAAEFLIVQPNQKALDRWRAGFPEAPTS